LLRVLTRSLPPPTSASLFSPSRALLRAPARTSQTNNPNRLAVHSYHACVGGTVRARGCSTVALSTQRSPISTYVEGAWRMLSCGAYAGCWRLVPWLDKQPALRVQARQDARVSCGGSNNTATRLCRQQLLQCPGGRDGCRCGGKLPLAAWHDASRPAICRPRQKQQQQRQRPDGALLESMRRAPDIWAEGRSLGRQGHRAALLSASVSAAVPRHLLLQPQQEQSAANHPGNEQSAVVEP
jgi:hypothetical protein